MITDWFLNVTKALRGFFSAFMGGSNRNYIVWILIKLDILANTILFGDPRETMSSRMAKNMSSNAFAYYGCKILHLIDKNHCQSKKRDFDNYKSNDHPIVFVIIFIGMVWLIYRLIGWVI